jgi:parallel beta-helix repeat protein
LIIHNSVLWLTGGGAIFQVTSSNVNIDGFTLQNADLGIFLDNVNNCMIDSNSILNCKNGIKSVDSGMNTISGNEIIGLGAQSTVGTIVINEICTNADWIELYNYGPAQDMSGWTLYADEFPIQGGISYTFPAGFVLPSLGFVHIDESAGIDDSDDLYINNNIWWNSPAESPSMVSITNNVGTVIDYVEWSADGTPYGGAYPTGPWTGTIIQAAGQDILYRHSDIDTNSALDWSIGTEAGVPATPHTLNPGQFGSPGEVGISVQGNGFYYDFLDDFSTNTGQWTYIGSASRTGGYMDVCPNGGGVGQGRFSQAINTMFICDFDWRIWDGNGADGLVMMFYKDMAYAPGAGGSLGFDGSNGYGIEFDQYVNAWDLPGEHIGLIQNNVGNHLVSVLDDRVRDSVWHHAQVVVDPTANSIKVYIDNNPVPLISWSGAISTAFSGFGFSAATGGLTDDHRVDNVRIRWLPTGNLITDNLVQDFDTGIGLYNAVSNQIYHNDIIGNTLQAFDNRADPINRWDNGAPGEGNFWSDYSGGGPYVIDANSQDNFPLTSRHTSLSEPEGPGSTPSEEPTPGPETTEESPELLTISVEPEPEELLLDIPISEDKETTTETAEEQSIQDQPGETSEVSTEQPAAQELSSTDIITAPQKPKARSSALLPSSLGLIAILSIASAVIIFRRKHKISK